VKRVIRPRLERASSAVERECFIERRKSVAALFCAPRELVVARPDILWHQHGLDQDEGPHLLRPERGSHQAGGRPHRMTGEYGAVRGDAIQNRDQIVAEDRPVSRQPGCRGKRRPPMAARVAGGNAETIAERRKQAAIGSGVEAVGVGEMQQRTIAVPCQAGNGAVSQRDCLTHWFVHGVICACAWSKSIWRALYAATDHR
jgi:hypothetical protein